jgi:hypothetical protein
MIIGPPPKFHGTRDNLEDRAADEAQVKSPHILFESGREVVDDDDLVSLGQSEPGKIGADETGPAGNEHTQSGTPMNVDGQNKRLSS